MRTLTETQFFSTLRRITETRSEALVTELTASFDEFQTALTEITQGEISVAKLIRQLKYAAAELIASQTIIQNHEAGKKCADRCVNS